MEKENQLVSDIEELKKHINDILENLNKQKETLEKLKESYEEKHEKTDDISYRLKVINNVIEFMKNHANFKALPDELRERTMSTEELEKIRKDFLELVDEKMPDSSSFRRQEVKDKVNTMSDEQLRFNVSELVANLERIDWNPVPVFSSSSKTKLAPDEDYEPYGITLYKSDDYKNLLKAVADDPSKAVALSKLLNEYIRLII